MQSARWIRQGSLQPRQLIAAITGFAAAQKRRSPPILLWAHCASAVDCEILCADGGSYAFVVIAPAKFAPGRALRWHAWALAPAIATYRQLGVRVHAVNAAGTAEIWLNGQRVARGAASAIGCCVVASGSFLASIPGAGFEERVIEGVFRQRLEAQHGWQFDSAWATPAESAAIAEAQGEQVAQQ